MPRTQTGGNGASTQNCDDSGTASLPSRCGGSCATQDASAPRTAPGQPAASSSQAKPMCSSPPTSSVSTPSRCADSTSCSSSRCTAAGSTSPPSPPIPTGPGLLKPPATSSWATTTRSGSWSAMAPANSAEPSTMCSPRSADQSSPLHRALHKPTRSLSDGCAPFATNCWTGPWLSWRVLSLGKREYGYAYTDISGTSFLEEVLGHREGPGGAAGSPAARRLGHRPRDRQTGGGDSSAMARSRCGPGCVRATSTTAGGRGRRLGTVSGSRSSSRRCASCDGRMRS